MKFEDNIAKTLYSICYENPFISNMVNSLARINDPKKIKQIGSFGAVITIENKSYLFIHPDVFNMMDLSSRKFLLFHEIYHILYEHAFREGTRDHKLWNLSCDLAINSNLQNKYKSVFFTKENYIKLQHIMDTQIPLLSSQIENNMYRVGFLPKDFKFEEGLAAEEYYQLLIEQGYGQGKKVKVVFSDGSGGETDIRDMVKDDIESVEEMIKNGSNPEIVKEERKGKVKQALDKAMSSGQGSISAELQELINKMLTVKINWKALLRNFLQVSTKFIYKRNPKRANKRFPDIILPSQKNIPKIKVLYIKDASGSVSEKEDAEMNGQLDMMKTQGIDIDYTIGDASISMKAEPYKKGSKFFKTYGGTCPNEWLKYADKYKDADIVIIFTDGEFGDKLIKIKKPILFCVTRSKCMNNIPSYYKKILVEVKE